MNKKMIESHFEKLKDRMYFILFIGFFNCLFAFSQEPFCHTASGFDLSSITSGIDPNLAREDGKYVVNLYFHLLSEDDGTNGSTEEDVINALNLLDDYFDNPLYADPLVYNDIIEFNLKCINYIPNSQLFNTFDCAVAEYSTDPALNPQFCQWHFVEQHTDGIDVIVNNNDISVGEGVASSIGSTFTSEFDCSDATTSITSVIVNKAGLSGSVLAHEIGHVLGLFHTFHPCGGLCSSNYDPVDIRFHNCGDEYVDDCQSSYGDFVLDTDIDARFEINSNTCDFEYAEYNEFQSFSCPLANADGSTSPGDYGSNVYTNIMSYHEESCKTHFTKGQVNRMKWHLDNVSIINALDDGSPNDNWKIIANTETWNSPRTIYEKLIVPNNSTLTISNTTIEFANENAGIIIENGGKLIINNNAILTGSSCDSNSSGYWSGIMVHGDYDSQAPPGELIANNCTIEKARTAVYAGKAYTIAYLNHNGALADVDLRGGKFQVSDVDFLNNETAIRIDAMYENNDIDMNNCRFINDEPVLDQYGQTISETSQVIIKNGQDLEITQCTFSVDVFNISGTNVTGITVNNSNLLVGLQPDENSGNTFNNLYKGIDVYDILNFSNYFAAYRNTFSNVAKGITLNTSIGSTIQNNFFNSIQSFYSSSAEAYGIMVYEAVSYSINNNEFYSGSPDDNYGIVLVSSNHQIMGANNYEDSEVFANKFKGQQPFKSAIQFEGDNQDSQLYCNDFQVSNQADWRFVNNAKLSDQVYFSTAPDENDRPFNTTWNPSSNWYIDVEPNGLAAGFALYPDATSKPDPAKVNSSLVDFENENFENQSVDCTIYQYTSPDDDPPTPSGCSSSGHLIRIMQEQEQIYQLVNQLECEGSIKSNVLLTSYYTNVEEFSLARNHLANTPKETDAQIVYHEIQTALLDALEFDNTAGKSAKALLTLNEIAEIPNGSLRKGENAALTESILSLLEGEIYDREISSKNTHINNGLSVNQVIPLKITPNPSNDFIQLEGKDSGIFFVYNLNGQQVLEHILQESKYLDVSTLKTGIYLCKFIDSKSNNVQVAKLIISK